jgi:DNA-binding SARP family transcriptional activator
MRFGLLGPLVLADECDTPVRLVGGRLRVLLAALLLHANSPVSRDALVELLWDGAPPSAPARTLRSHVGRLRRALGPDAARVAAREPGYLIRLEPGELDLLEFEELCRRAGEALRGQEWTAAGEAAARALGLWRGEPLLDVPSQPLRDRCGPRLGQLRLQAFEDRAEAQLQLGRHEQLIPQLRDLAAAHALHERFHAQLMLALYRAGRQAEALDAYRDARRTLVAELGVEPGPELRRIHAGILAGDSVLCAAPGENDHAGPQGSGAVRERERAEVPRQLPAAPRHFTGRRAELDLLAALPHDGDAGTAPGGAAVVCAVDGMAGIGKTALAVHAAHLLSERYPDGQLYLDLHGYTKGFAAREPGEALERLLRAVGVPAAQIPADTEQRAALYRQRLAGSRTLIVLDNAAAEAQVRPLLPAAPGCLVLLTGRRRMKGLDDACSLSLDVLPRGDAVTLLRAVAGPGRIPADGPLPGEVAGLCGYLPLALRIAASLLRHRPAWDLEHVAALLRDQHRRVGALDDGERAVAAVFDLSYASLDARHRALWRRLGLVPGPDLDAYAAAALLESDPATAADLLEDLVDHSLLAEYAEDRFRLHDLLRAHARALADAADPVPERRAAVDRLLHYYAHTAQSASALIARDPRPRPDGPAPRHAPVPADPAAALAWLRAEHPNLDAAFAHAAAHGLERHAIALAAGMAEIQFAAGPWTRALAVHREAAEAAGRLGLPAARGGAMADLGRVRAAVGDYPGADAAHAQALEVYCALGDRVGQATALTRLGRARQVAGDFAGADAAYGRALEACRAVGNRLGEATALTQLGRVRQVTGDYPRAGAAYTRALELYRALGNRLGEATALINLGRVRCLTGDYTGAGAAHARALEVYRAVGNRLGEANALTALGRVRCLTGDCAGADAVVPALEIYRALEDRPGEAYALTELGRIRQAAGDCAGARDALSAALDIYRGLGDRCNEAWALNFYAAALAGGGRRPLALVAYQRALAMNRELDKPDDEAISLEGIAEHHLAGGDAAHGAAYLRRAAAIYRRLGMGPDAARVHARLAALASDQVGARGPS